MKEILVTTRQGANSSEQDPEDRSKSRSNQNKYIGKDPRQISTRTMERNDRLMRAKVDRPKIDLPKVPSKRVQFESPVAKEMPYVEVPKLDEARQITSKPSWEINDRASENRKVTASHQQPSPAYRARAPVEDRIDIDEVVEGILDLSVSIPIRQLAGVSGAIRDGIKKQVTRNRKLIDLEERQSALQSKTKIGLEKALETLPKYEVLIQVTNCFEGLKQGTWVAADPVEQYLNSIEGDETPEVYVSHESENLRSIYSRINNIGQEECLVDSGSQIVSMSKEVAIRMGLTWDPSIRINMQSANRQIEKSLGLARHVGFTFGGFTIFLQVHVLESPAYGVLLGRPFDTFTRSVVQNEMDGGQTIAVTDPNSGRQAVIPTYKRGESPDTLQKNKAQGFQASLMI